MKKFLIILIFISVGLSSQSCKKFLNVDPIDDLSGNNYWKSKSDVERFAWSLYALFRVETMGIQDSPGKAYVSRFFFPATGDLRLAPVASASAWVNRGNYLDPLRKNDIKRLLSSAPGNYNTFYNIVGLTNWSGFYNIIQMSNVFLYNLDNLEAGILSTSETAQYRAEAIFMRNLVYFFLVRMYGDVPYYTNAFNSEPLPRTDMMVVLQNIADDMKSQYKNLPWTYEDNSLVGSRAMRGGAIGLMMHINMWLAGFSTTDKTPYYTEVKTLGKELMDENMGAYGLLPITDYKTIFKGHSKESLFELTQSLNYSERFNGTAQFSNQILRYPYRVDASSFLIYDLNFIDKVYPESSSDARRLLWFEDIRDRTGKFMFKKYLNFFNSAGTSLTNSNPDDSQIIFRYSDAILMRAEALAELGENADALTYLNMVRTRAKAETLSSSGSDLRNDIFLERCRELFGEGHYYYDLVRTKRATDRNFIVDAMTIEDFDKGAWTWPIDPQARINNPHMRLNSFWE